MMAETKCNSIERAVMITDAVGLKTEIYCSGGNVWPSATWDLDDGDRETVYSTSVSKSGVLAEWKTEVDAWHTHRLEDESVVTGPEADELMATFKAWKERA